MASKLSLGSFWWSVSDQWMVMEWSVSGQWVTSGGQGMVSGDQWVVMEWSVSGLPVSCQQVFIGWLVVACEWSGVASEWSVGGERWSGYG